METTVRLGRIAGITIGVNWSVLIVAWLIWWGLATDALPTLAPGSDGGAYWLAGGLTALTFFASLLAHELGHSLLARRRGVDVREITLWMLGGVAKLEGEVHEARDEVRIAVVGPVVSVGLAVLFGFLAVALSAAGAPELVVAVPTWLSSLNLILAIFNLIPAFPMDGGRVLRGILWRHWNDRLRATRAAAATGTVFGYALIGLGFLSLTAGAGLSGIWLAFIGLFIVFAARVEASQVTQSTLLGGVTVADVMTPAPLVAPDSISVQSLLDEYVLRNHVSAYPLVDDAGRVSGLATLARLRTVAPDARASTSVGAIACPLSEVLVVPSDAPLEQLVGELLRSREGRALVLDDHRLVGIVSRTDITRALELRDLAQR